MRRWVWLAGVLAATTFTGAPAGAADLPTRDDPPYVRGPSPYDDPRYGDIYRHPEPPPPRHYEPAPPPAPRYGYGYGERPQLPPMREPEYRPYPYTYPPSAPPPRYSDAPRYAPTSCVPRQEIRRRLSAEGWSEFQDLELGVETAVFKARRPDGRQFALRIDRCSGQIVEARQIGPSPYSPYGPYAYGPRRYDRPY